MYRQRQERQRHYWGTREEKAREQHRDVAGGRGRNKDKTDLTGQDTQMQDQDETRHEQDQTPDNLN